MADATASRIAQYLTHLVAADPTLAGASARLVSHGQTSDVLIVAERLVARFPRHADGVRRLAQEAAVLSALRGRLPLAIPAPSRLGLAPPRAGTAYLAYPLIAGRPLWPADLTAADDAALDGLASQLGGFLAALHAVPPSVLGLTLLVPDSVAEWTDRLARIRTTLFPHLRPDARLWVTRHVERFLADSTLHAVTPLLIHGDFGGSNLLWEPARRAITGVIDFGGAGLGDPAYDCAGLLGYGEPFLRRVALAYPAIWSMWPRIQFYHGTFALLEALYGAEHGDPVVFAAGLAHYR